MALLRRDISKYSYLPVDIRRSVRSEDFWKYDLNADNIEEKSIQIANDFSNDNCAINDIRMQKLGKKTIFTLGSLYDALTVR